MRNFFWSENKHLETEVKSFFDTIEEYNQKEFNGEISMLLLGSMSRGEASWKTINGVDTIVSDIEVLTHLPHEFSKLERLYQVFEIAKAQCFPDQHSPLFHIDYCVICDGYNMSKMERKLLTFDANVFAYTVVGKDYKSTMPKVTYSNINMQDIWEVLIHRLFSVLYFGKPLKDAGKIEEYKYNIAKNSLDLMTILLVNHGQLISGFKNRLEAVKKLNISDETKHYFEFCLAIKLSIDCKYSYTITEMESLFIQILEDQNNLFGFHIINYLHNFKNIMKRHAGQLKRALQTKHVPRTQKNHLAHMVEIFKNNSHLSQDCITDNFVLNGYPIIKYE